MDAYRYDHLTGIPNMTHFFELIKESRKDVLERGGTCVVGFTDFNGMKYFNKKHGYAEGDKLLKDFASLLVKHFGKENSCRIAQDNFAFFAETEGLEDTVLRLFAEFPEMCGDKRITVRIGLYPDKFGYVEASLACDRARQACNLIKEINKSAYRFFDDTMLAYENNHQYVLDNLDRALEEHWVKAYYQPIVRTANGRVCDEEALARWIDPVKGMLSPADFIPILEDSKQIYRVDLYMVDEILKKMKAQKDEGLYIVPVSINLSRTDFDMCDMVEEVCSRMDKAGVSRDMLTIEITESVLGTDLDFMIKQVERFQKLGFKVWMDDFGSGYSSLDLLQTIHFDLIKLDMRFMKQFDNSDKSRVIVTEIIKMAVGLGIETVTEGVERADQVDFLREVGCTKLQGYYYCKPVPFEEIVERNKKGVQIGFENPDESGYYESLGKINLYDMSVTIDDSPEKLGQYFNTLPMAIIETDDETFKCIRGNRSYREFIGRISGTFDVGVSYRYEEISTGKDSIFVKSVRQCAKTGERVFLDEKLDRDSIIHAFVRRIAVNPVSGVIACQVVVLGIVKDAGTGLSFADVANSLSADYMDLYHVNLKTLEYTEYLPDPSGEGLVAEKSGGDFFAQCRKDAAVHLYPEDVEKFVSAYNEENVVRSIDEHGAFMMTYRLMMEGRPVYCSMKAIRMSNDKNFMIVGVSNVDAQMRQQEALERVREERTTYARISALAGNYIGIYTVDPVTDRFIQYGAKQEFEDLGLDKAGENFFVKSRKEIVSVIDPEDYDHFTKEFTKENILKDIQDVGVFTLDYKLIFNNKPTYVRLKAAMVEEKDGPQLIVGIRNVDEQVRLNKIV